MTSDELPIVPWHVLSPTITMKDHTIDVSTTDTNSHIERVSDKFDAHMVRHRIPQPPAATQIQHGGSV